ncbi:MAG: hypothetical protein KAS23_08520 [Anaerohalosphaera sp.]|nr:hypothetical protein [Anaerohalosphaera sp.]
MRHLAVVLLPLIVLGICSGQEPTGTGIFSVKVVSGTAGGSSVAGAEVMLSVYDKNTEIDFKSGVAGADGTSSFEVTTGIGSVAVARVKHNDMLFSSSAVELRPGQKNFSTAVMVYDVSEDNSVLKIGQHQIIIRVYQNYTIAVEEYIQIVNPTDRAVTSSRKDDDGHPVVLEVLLPKGYRDLQCKDYFQMQALVLGDKGFYDIMAVPPGKYDASFSYMLDVDWSKLNFVRPVSYPTSNVIVIAKLADAKLDGLGEPQSKVTMDTAGDSNYYVLSEKFEPDQAIKFEMTGLKANPEKKLVIIFSVIFSILALSVLYRMRPKKK